MNVICLFTPVSCFPPHTCFTHSSIHEVRQSNIIFHCMNFLPAIVHFIISHLQLSNIFRKLIHIKASSHRLRTHIFSFFSTSYSIVFPKKMKHPLIFYLFTFTPSSSWICRYISKVSSFTFDLQNNQDTQTHVKALRRESEYYCFSFVSAT